MGISVLEARLEISIVANRNTYPNRYDSTEKSVEKDTMTESVHRSAGPRHAAPSKGSLSVNRSKSQVGDKRKLPELVQRGVREQSPQSPKPEKGEGAKSEQKNVSQNRVNGELPSIPTKPSRGQSRVREQRPARIGAKDSRRQKIVSMAECRQGGELSSKRYSGQPFGLVYANRHGKEEESTLADALSFFSF